MKIILLIELLCVFSLGINFCYAVEDVLKTKEIFRPGTGYFKIIDYKPLYGGNTYRKNSIHNLFEALYFASPTLGHTDFPASPAIGSYTPQKKHENKIIREHLTSVGLQAEQDALNMIRQLDDPTRLVTEEHWDRMSALGYAVGTQRVKIVEAMLHRGIDKKLLNQRMGNGRTPLSLAVWRLSGPIWEDSKKIIAMLVDAGADPNVSSQWDGKPIDVIQKKIKDLRDDKKESEGLLNDKQKMKDNLVNSRSYSQDPYQSLEFDASLQKHMGNIKSSLEHTKGQIQKYREIEKIFKNAEPFTPSSPKPTTPATPVKSILQKSLSKLHKQLAGLRKKLEKLSNALQVLKSKLS